MNDILPIVILGVYVLIPLTVSWGYNRLGSRNSVAITHITTFFLVIFYPHIVWAIRDFFNPPEDECGNPDFFGNLINLIIMVPVTQWLQYFFNKQYNNYKSKDQEVLNDKEER